MHHIKILGSGQEVGRTSIMLSMQKEHILLDCGINVENMGHPIEPNVPLDAVVLSHAHLDHSGHIPCIFRHNFNGRLFATETTLDFCSLLLRDSLKVQKKKGFLPRYGLHELSKMKKHETVLEYGKKFQMSQPTRLTVFDAGHTPGSASTLIETNGKRIVYTGDIKFSESSLLNPAFSDFKNIDVLITESTYTQKDHPDRKKTFERLRKDVAEAIALGGVALLPVFTVGRAQEMLLEVSELGLPVVMDGMAVSATAIALSRKNNVCNWERLWEAFKGATKIKKKNERKDVAKKPCIIISGNGMLNGGPANYYMKQLLRRPECRLILSGFQMPGTIGRTLMDTGRYVSDGIDEMPRIQVGFMDLSSHCGRTELINFIKKVNPGKVVLVHGEKTPEFSQELKSMGFDAYAPKNGDVVKV